MILLSKKRIGIIVSVMLIGIFTFMLQTNKDIDTIETVSIPVSEKIIIIDAGHGKPDEGAQSNSRYYRSRNQLKNSIKTSKFVRTKWGYSNINKK